MSNLKISNNGFCLVAIIIALRLCDGEIHLKPIDLSDIDGETEHIDTLLLAVVPDELRTAQSPSAIESNESFSNRSTSNSSEILGGLQLDKKQVEMLRRSWRDSCNRKAARLCRKACVSTYRIVCSAYLCKRSMKRSFKRECKRNCKGRFVSGSRSDTD